jgi:hypothetical protein
VVLEKSWWLVEYQIEGADILKMCSLCSRDWICPPSRGRRNERRALRAHGVGGLGFYCAREGAGGMERAGRLLIQVAGDW